MNILHKISLISATAACAAIIIAASSCSEARATNAAKSVASEQATDVISPKIPSHATFAGEKIDLDRVDMYERFDRELTSMAFTHGNTLLVIKRANRLFPVMAPILKEAGVPSDMLYLACIESTLNPRALSGAKAGGIWQFMPTTAKEYGLEVNDYVDERYNIEKATRAACKYLKRAYARYGSWESVAASYNGGMARVSKELEAQGVDTAYDLYLTDETSRYMFRLLAMKCIMENPAAFGYRISADQLYQPMEYETVEVSTPVSDWPAWAKSHGIDYMTLRDSNPWIRAKSLPNKTGKTYKVLIPTKNSMYRSKQKKQVYNNNWISK
ncbi:MAG: lytic transglycosylase domain-containing protein [Muribaculaceae bacterium]|nr:lytic transglycosylase domain-containing protein [Muribaculaceae bacterium]